MLDTFQIQVCFVHVSRLSTLIWSVFQIYLAVLCTHPYLPEDVKNRVRCYCGKYFSV